MKLSSKYKGVEVLSETEWIVRTALPPRDGLANRDVIEQISEHLEVPKSKVKIIKGEKSKKFGMASLPCESPLYNNH